MFNTLKYAKMLEEVGFSRNQAETSVKLLADTMEENLASKQDMKDLRVELRQEMKDLGVEFRQELKNLEMRLTVRMGAMLAGTIAILTAIQKLTY